MKPAAGIIISLSWMALGCNEVSKETKKAEPDSAAEQKTVPPPKKENVAFGDRLKIAGDFDGNGTIDTVYESYISELTGRETFKTLDSTDWDNNVGLVIANKPECRIYSTISPADTFTLTNEHQQIGLYFLENLGDLNNDKGDELGYIINWADYSNLNSYHILTLSGNKKWKELFYFSINEMVNLDSENLFRNGSMIKREENGLTRYKFYSDTATVEEGVINLKK